MVFCSKIFDEAMKHKTCRKNVYITRAMIYIQKTDKF
nr:MAG TPA: hypothetical protein [Caudoviricetes sp.]